jgi:hypothetical protein
LFPPALVIRQVLRRRDAPSVRLGDCYLLMLFFIASGVGLSPLYCGHLWPVVPLLMLYFICYRNERDVGRYVIFTKFDVRSEAFAAAKLDKIFKVINRVSCVKITGVSGTISVPDDKDR